mgnify:FL=1|tara:strand:+ start:623 stop:1030 length:408 start_codon:yes stop_codon:yes gene_type:complete
MKRSQLKALVKECVKEVILEDGLLKSIVSEVAQGLGGSLVIERQEEPVPRHEAKFKEKMKSNRKQVLKSIGKGAYDDAKKKFDNPALFEGTKPLPGGGGSAGPLGVDTSSEGIGLDNIPGMSNWGNILDKMNKRK